MTSNLIRCNKCNGTGLQRDYVVIWKGGIGFYNGLSCKCTKCHGDGDLLWIDHIMGGKKGKIFYEDRDIILEMVYSRK